MYVEMIETRFLKILLKSFHETYSNLFKKTTRYMFFNVLQLTQRKSTKECIRNTLNRIEYEIFLLYLV